MKWRHHGTTTWSLPSELDHSNWSTSQMVPSTTAARQRVYCSRYHSTTLRANNDTMCCFSLIFCYQCNRRHDVGCAIWTPDCDFQVTCPSNLGVWVYDARAYPWCPSSNPYFRCRYALSDQQVLPIPSCWPTQDTRRASIYYYRARTCRSWPTTSSIHRLTSCIGMRSTQ